MKKFQLELYIMKGTEVSCRAERNIRGLMETDALKGISRLTVIDIQARPDLAEREKLLATPTLIKKNAPKRTIIGDLSDYDKVLFRLGLKDIPPRAVSGETIQMLPAQRTASANASGSPDARKDHQRVRDRQTERRKMKKRRY
jgi:circadian clock protein KaiB